jgi:peptide chain release factor 2
MLSDLGEKLTALEKKLIRLRSYLKLDAKDKRIKELEKQMAAPGFWKDQKTAGATVTELKNLKKSTQSWEECNKKFKELKELAEIAEEKDAAGLKELQADMVGLTSLLDALELKTLFSETEDVNNAILSIHAGAGGTESCDWAAMLLRMYSRWAEKRGYSTRTLDYLPGEEAGLKNVTLLISGEYAYGYLKAESGVHRLVRISPFDANKRRHTSFASVDVIPEISDDIEVEIKNEDLKIDTFRSSGPGGQHVNVTDSAVRITHLPTKIVVQCQSDRSQHKNKASALKILRAKLYEREKQERKRRLEAQYAQKQDIAWGSQIRSYVMHPYTMVKDHRTKVEVGNVSAVMDGEIDKFIEAYLRWRVGK